MIWDQIHFLTNLFILQNIKELANALILWKNIINAHINGIMLMLNLSMKSHVQISWTAYVTETTQWKSILMWG